MRPKINIDYQTLNRGFTLPDRRVGLKKLTWPTRKLWRLEVIDETEDRVKVHYISWASQYDEWLPKERVIDIPDEVEEEDAYGNLKQQI